MAITDKYITRLDHYQRSKLKELEKRFEVKIDKLAEAVDSYNCQVAELYEEHITPARDSFQELVDEANSFIQGVAKMLHQEADEAEEDKGDALTEDDVASMRAWADEWSDAEVENPADDISSEAEELVFNDADVMTDLVDLRDKL